MIKLITEIFKKVGILGLAIIACGYLTARTIKDSNTLQQLRAKCALQEQALKRPATFKTTARTTTTVTKYINLTDAQKANISAKYNMRIEALNELLKEYKERTRTTSDEIAEQSKPEVPAIPEQTAGTRSPWSAGVVIMKDQDNRKVGAIIQREIGKKFTAGMAIAPEHIQAEILYRF